MELCDLMIAEKINLPWSCFTRVDCVTAELLKKMKAAGCYQIFYGVEAGNQRLLNLMSKGITMEQVRNAFKWTKDAGIEALASFIIGLPTETKAEARASAAFAKEIDADYAHWEVFTPYPGTNLYKIALEHGRLLTTDLNQYSPWRDEPVYLPFGRTAEELKETKMWIYRQFYLRPFFMLRRLKSLLHLPFTRILKLVESGLVMTFSK
jgi:anaerobic magnesium-protoporphyrin IX monomethyl ester cyclase